MSLESVFANPPPLVGEVNKDSTQYGENQSTEDAAESNEVVGDESPAKEEDDATEAVDLEEGEIIDDSEEESPDKDTVTSDDPPPPTTQDPPVPAKEVAGEPEGDQDKKRRKKKEIYRRRKDKKEYERRDTKKRKKRKLYVDHDRVDDGEITRENFMLGDRHSPGPYGTPPYPDSPMSDYDDSGKEDYFINGTRNRGPEINKRKNTGRGRLAGKKKGNLQDGPPMKRSKRPPLLQTPDIRRMCRFFVEGKCNKGGDCPFSHSGPAVKKTELCKFYLNSYCTKGEDCLYVHEEFPCKFFHTGAQCFQGDNCKFSHEPLNEDTSKMLEQCLDSGFGLCDGPSEERERDQPPDKYNPRPSLLGSPPRYVKEAVHKLREQERKIPSLFDIEIQPPRSFYTDTLHSPNVSPQKVMPVQQPPPFMDLPPVRPPNPPPNNADPAPNSSSQEGNGNTENSVPIDDLKDSEETDQPSTSESESDGKKTNIEIPSHLPKKQRELFMRIQQHQQREIQSGGSDAADKKNGESDDNWYSSDDDDDDDRPLTDVLKKLQSQPVQFSKVEVNPVASHVVNSVSDSSLSFNITHMLNVIRSTSKGNVRDPRLHNNVSSKNPSTIKDTGDSVNNTTDPLPNNQTSVVYQLRAITVAQPNPADRLKLLKASQNDPRLQSDPRIQKQLSNANDAKPPKLLDPRLKTNNSVEKPENPCTLKVLQTDRPLDPRLQKAIIPENNRTTDPRLLKNSHIENNKPLDPRLQRPAKLSDPRHVDLKPTKHMDPRPPMPLDLRPSTPMGPRPVIPMNLRPPMPLNIRPVNMQPPIPAALRLPLPVDLRLPPPMDLRFPPPMDLRHPPPVDLRHPPPMDMRIPPPVDIRIPPPVDLRPMNVMSVEPRPAGFVDPRSKNL